MKKVSVCLCLIIAFNATAQIKKGSWMLGGTAAGGMMNLVSNTDEITDFKGRFFNFKPEIGYFVTPKLAVGARFKANLMHSSHVNNSANFGMSYFTWNERSYMFSPFMRYYFYTKRAFNFYYQFNTSGELSRSQFTVNYKPNQPLKDWSTFTTFSVSNSLGFDYFLTKNIALETDWNYSYYHEFKEKDNKQPVQKQAFPKLTFTPEFRIKL